MIRSLSQLVFLVCGLALAALACSDATGGSAANDDAGSDSGGEDAPLPDTPPFEGETGTVLFVTQVPVEGFTSVVRTFSNHVPTVADAPRGGALMIRYPDGALRNLTAEAGYGMEGRQGANAIAVREPTVHWSGNRALFAMVIGAPTEQYVWEAYYWQIYEVTGLGRDDEVSIERVDDQPSDFNNVAPIYASDDDVIFVSDRPRGGERHLYPRLDEYESAPTTTGLWRIDAQTGELIQLEDAPSGVFSPQVDSYGRIVFIKWDHLQRDQQALPEYGAFTWADESAAAEIIASLDGMEVFPEPRDEADSDYDPAVSAHTFNHFLPWEIDQDGSAEETLNHVGRHELGGSYTEGSLVGDDNLTYSTPEQYHANRHYLRGDGGLFQMREDPLEPGRYLAVQAPEFGTAASGPLLWLTGAATLTAEDMVLTPITDPEGEGGRYRNPLALSDGTLIAAYTATSGDLENQGSRQAPAHNYAFRLVVLEPDGELWRAGATLTGGIQASVSYYDPDVLVSWEGTLWELDPVEVAPRERPTPRTTLLPAPEQGVLTDLGVDEQTLRDWLRANELALIVSRNVTNRDRADLQQPYNLRVPAGAESVAASGAVYDVRYLQLFQGDAVRGYGGVDDPSEGRRLLPREMRDDAGANPPVASGPAGSVEVADDGSVAAFVPARRALTWQLTAPDGTPVVRERNWVSFQAGEIRSCPACHGLNTQNQLGGGEPTNPPIALQRLLEHWEANR